MQNDIKFIETDENYQLATNFIMYNNLNIGSGKERYQQVEKRLAKTGGIISQEDAMKLLDEV